MPLQWLSGQVVFFISSSARSEIVSSPNFNIHSPKLIVIWWSFTIDGWRICWRIFRAECLELITIAACLVIDYSFTINTNNMFINTLGVFLFYKFMRFSQLWHLFRPCPSPREGFWDLPLLLGHWLHQVMQWFSIGSFIIFAFFECATGKPGNRCDIMHYEHCCNPPIYNKCFEKVRFSFKHFRRKSHQTLLVNIIKLRAETILASRFGAVVTAWLTWSWLPPTGQANNPSSSLSRQKVPLHFLDFLEC